MIFGDEFLNENDVNSHLNIMVKMAHIYNMVNMVLKVNLVTFP